MRLTTIRLVLIYIGSAILCWAIGYAAGIKNGTNGAMAAGYGGGALLTLLIVLFLRQRSYRAAFRVETWRGRAAELRLSDPDTYQHILAQARSDPGAFAAAQRDPDAYVALFMSFASETQARPHEAASDPAPVLTPNPRNRTDGSAANGVPTAAMLRRKQPPAALLSPNTQRCPSCSGRGFIALGAMATQQRCADCNGTGRQLVGDAAAETMIIRCNQCGGRGLIVLGAMATQQRCASCDGKGWLAVPRPRLGTSSAPEAAPATLEAPLSDDARAACAAHGIDFAALVALASERLQAADGVDGGGHIALPEWASDHLCMSVVVTFAGLHDDPRVERAFAAVGAAIAAGDEATIEAAGDHYGHVLADVVMENQLESVVHALRDALFTRGAGSAAEV